MSASTTQRITSGLAAALLLCMPMTLHAYESGSTGTDGAFAPTVDTELPLPPSGILNFTNVTIPADVTVTFARNAANTPVRILASGDVVIDGAINVSGSSGGASLDGGAPGKGGPGGFDGGRGGLIGSSGFPAGGDGLGPGRSTGAANIPDRNAGWAGYGTAGRNSSGSVGTQGRGGPAYGNAELIPLIGGSGGGGSSGNTLRGAGGGGGGGALLIAASGTVTINGSITANGGGRGSPNSATGVKSAGYAGLGSGGAIRIVATTVTGEGAITAISFADDGVGRIRIEAENMLRVANTTPSYRFSTPNIAFVPNAPTIRIASVGGVTAPVAPVGDKDVVLPGTTVNPVPVTFETAGVPLGTIITLTAAPQAGTAVSTSSSGVSGSQASGSDSVNIDLPNGNSVLTAQTSFTITASLGDVYAPYADGERVREVQLAYVPGTGQQTTYVTVSGKRVTWLDGTRVN